MDLFTSPYSDACSTVGVAAKTGNIEKLRQLLQSGKDYTVKDNRGWYPMHEAAHAGHIECVRLLLETAENDCDDLIEILTHVFPPAYDGSTPLSLAARAGHLDVLQVLSPLYTDVDCDHTGFPMHLACEYGYLKCLESLVHHLPHLINSINITDGQSPLHCAVENQNVPIVEYLLHHNAHTDLKDSDHDKSPLHTAVCTKNIVIINLLIQAGCDVNIVDNCNCSPLYLAAQNGRLDIVALLLENGADPTIGMCLDHNVGPDLEPCIILPLCVAAEKGHYDVLKLLIEATLSHTDSPAHSSLAVKLAVNRERRKCLELLLDNGFSTITNCINQTEVWDGLLYQSENSIRIIQLLLDHGTIFYKEEYSLLECSIWKNLMPSNGFILFLNAGLAELICQCKVFPEKSNFLDQLTASVTGDQHKLKGFKCLEYFPFLNIAKYSMYNVNMMPKLEFRRFTTPKVPTLSETCRWILRCKLARRFGLINSVNVQCFHLPKLLNDYLVYK